MVRDVFRLILIAMVFFVGQNLQTQDAMGGIMIVQVCLI